MINEKEKFVQTKIKIFRQNLITRDNLGVEEDIPQERNKYGLGYSDSIKSSDAENFIWNAIKSKKNIDLLDLKTMKPIEVVTIKKESEIRIP